MLVVPSRSALDKVRRTGHLGTMIILAAFHLLTCRGNPGQDHHDLRLGMRLRRLLNHAGRLVAGT